MQHNSFKKDIDLLSEAYGQVRRGAPSQEFFDMLDDVRMEVDDYYDVIDKLEELLGRKLSPLEVEWVEDMVSKDS